MVWIGVAAVSGALAVTAGAFGAHALRSQVSPAMLATWHTAVQYHLLHSVVLLVLGLFSHSAQKNVDLPAWLFLLGMLLFSGSLYGLVLTQQGWLGPVTPIGGILLIAGWLAVLWLARA